MNDREKPEPPDSDRHGLEERVERALRSVRPAADVETLARNVLTELASVVPVVQAALYVVDSEGTPRLEGGVSRSMDPRLRIAATYAATGDVGKSFALGEGLVGQCARERRKLSVSDVPAEHFRIRSGLGVSAPRQLTLVPVSGADPVAAVLELATFEPLEPLDERFVARLAEGLAPILHDRLPSFRPDPPSSRRPAPSSRRGSARETARYKPELFARMGHELRTPLNSLLVLSQMLAENADKNLTAKQMAFARAINASGNELLALIDEILELAKIESNSLSIEPAEMTLEHLREHLDLSFRQVAAQKGVGFRVDMRADAPAAIVTDPKRLQQILKNLLSNALEFAEKGTVSLSVSRARFGWSSDHPVLSQAEAVVAFGVTHSGAGGISGERSAFADVFSNAGEGGQPALARLDCTVSREVARLLGGELRVAAPDAGSTVTLYLPAVYHPPSSSVLAPALEEAADLCENSSHVSLPLADSGVERGPATAETSNAGRTDDRVILTIEGDAGLEDAVVRSAGARGYRSVTTSNIMGEIGAPSKALPAAVLLDLRGKDLEGWIVLDRLRQDPATRHIPVAVLVAREHELKARRMGAAVLLEQASPAQVDAALTELELFAAEPERRVLFVQLGAIPAEKDLLNLITAEGVEVRVTHSAEEGLAALRTERFHACVWSLGAAEPGDLSSLGALPALERTPIIVYTGRPLKPEAVEQLRKCSQTSMPMSAASPERLLHELSLHLYRPEAAYSSSQRHMLAKAARQPPELACIRVLLIDADVRNVFAMTSALERHGVLVSYADGVQGGLALIDREPSIAALLVDAGLALENDHELLRHVRRARHPALPFIALAAAPSATEREQCLRAGASHYAAKPVAARHLISVLRVASVDAAERGLVVCR